MVSIVVPVFNEALILEKNILQLFDFCQKNLDPPWQIIISDNNSTDQTPVIARRLAASQPAVKYFFLPERGKGRAVMSAWRTFQSDVYVFMDADLAVALSALPVLVTGLARADLVVGSRFLVGSSVERSFPRRLFSYFLRCLLHLFLGLKVKDAPCGFKAVNHKVVVNLLPQIQNQTWFFDTELLVLAENQGYQIEEIPVCWREQKSAGRRSKVSLFSVASEYLKNIYQLHQRLKS